MVVARSESIKPLIGANQGMTHDGRHGLEVAFASVARCRAVTEHMMVMRSMSRSLAVIFALLNSA